MSKEAMTPERVLQLVEEYGEACGQLGAVIAMVELGCPANTDLIENRRVFRRAHDRLLDAIGHLRGQDEDKAARGNADQPSTTGCGQRLSPPGGH